MVLGVVTDKHADDYRVDIRASSSATLSALSFEGATKRSRPRLQVTLNPKPQTLSP
jgi:exosome complex component RRP40